MYAMQRRLDLDGKQFGQLTVVSFSHVYKQKTFWKCRCNCGKLSVVYRGHLTSGHTRSCGCLVKETVTKHGLCQRRGYFIYRGIMSRCYQVGAKDWEYWGKRGIVVCNEWKDSLLTFLDWYDNQPNAGKTGYSLDRIDNDGPYSPENCRIATMKEQNYNRRTPKSVQLKLDTANLKIKQLEDKIIELESLVCS